jgi:NADH-quinone oxidoreductase subunit G
MPTCVIDGKTVEFKLGENLVEVAKRAGVEVPVFCYHPGLTVVAQCRMCAVEVEKMPKIQTACSTKAAEGMVVHTQSERVKKARESVMEFLLINHPLDCPICDKSGECDLQNNSYSYGSAYMRYTEERRTYVDLDMGPVIKKNMNRCIHCTRCIRFGDEVAGVREMVALKRGNNTEITTLDGRALETDYAGNYADICPTGSLTLKDFRFHKRAWMLKKTPTICEGCSKGCNMEVQQDNGVIYRCVPRENPEINKHWLCDEGRFNFHYLHDSARVIEPSTLVSDDLKISSWDQALEAAQTILKGKKVALLVGSDLTQEELELAREFAQKQLAGAPIAHFGTEGIKKVADDGPADRILKRKSKTANLNGAEKLGIPAFDRLPSGTQVAIVMRGGRAALPPLVGVDTIGIGVFMRDEARHFKVVLPGTAFAEKEGTIFNHEGREQRFVRAIVPPRQCKQLAETLMMWTHRREKTGAA